MCISLCRSGNMPISMLWLVLVSSRGTDGRTNDDRGKDVVPKIVHNFYGGIIFVHHSSKYEYL